MASSAEVGLAKLREIHEVLAQISRDGSKFFEKGNKAAGVRARKWLQDLKQLAQDLRIAIQRCKTENEQARLADWHAAPQVPDVSHMHEAVGRMEDFVGGPVQVFDGALIGANGVVLSSSMDAVAAPTMDADVAHASGLPLAPHAHPTH